jgi:hypothetical protein
MQKSVEPTVIITAFAGPQQSFSPSTKTDCGTPCFWCCCGPLCVCGGSCQSLCSGKRRTTSGAEQDVETKVVLEGDLPNGPYSDGGIESLTVYVLPNSTWLDVGILVKQSVDKTFSSQPDQKFVTFSYDTFLGGVTYKGGQVSAGEHAAEGNCKTTLFVESTTVMAPPQACNIM